MKRIWTVLAPHHLLNVFSPAGLPLPDPVYYYEFLPRYRRYFFARYCADNLSDLCLERWDSIAAVAANSKCFGWYDTDERGVRFYTDDKKARLRAEGYWRDAPGYSLRKLPDGSVSFDNRPALEVDALLYLPLGEESPWLGPRQ